MSWALILLVQLWIIVAFCEPISPAELASLLKLCDMQTSELNSSDDCTKLVISANDTSVNCVCSHSEEFASLGRVRQMELFLSNFSLKRIECFLLVGGSFL
jgi:hypothetical protein